jgi:hypothetical protein
MSESHKGKHLSEEYKQKLRQKLKGRIISQQTREKGSQSRRRYYQQNDVWNKGIPHTEETKQKISKAMKGHKVNARTQSER